MEGANVLQPQAEPENSAPQANGAQPSGAAGDPPTESPALTPEEPANKNPEETPTTTGNASQPRRKRGLDKFLMPALVVLLFVVIGAIIYFTLHSVGIIADEEDGPTYAVVSDPTADEVNSETLSEKVAIYASLSDDEREQYADLEDQLKSYIEKSTSENGADDSETIFAVLAYSKFLVADVRGSEAEDLLVSALDGMEDVQAIVLYSFALVNYYEEIGDTEAEAEYLERILAYDEGTIPMTRDNWDDIRYMAEYKLNNLYSTEEDDDEN